MTDIAPGRYQHFKGKEYDVLGIACHSETQEAFVVYRKRYDDGGLCIRPASMFLERVTRDGYDGPRFVKVD